MLSTWLSSCEIGDLTIFLDVRRDRYLAIPSVIAKEVRERHYSKVPTKILDQIQAWGWTEAADSGIFEQKTAIPQATEELSAITRDGPISYGLIRSAFFSVFVTKWAQKVLRLEWLLNRISMANASAPVAQGASMAQIVRAFEATDRVIFGAKACLTRSLALHRLLAANGHRSALVFGVRLNPFRAHCWLQQNNVVINDTIEQIGMFRPLRAVE